MIEGGSRVLSSFLRSPSRSGGSPVVDTVVVTVAPMFIGEGVGVVPKVSSGLFAYDAGQKLTFAGGRDCFTSDGDCPYREDGQGYGHALYTTAEDAMIDQAECIT